MFISAARACAPRTICYGVPYHKGFPGYATVAERSIVTVSVYVLPSTPLVVPSMGVTTIGAGRAPLFDISYSGGYRNLRGGCKCMARFARAPNNNNMRNTTK